MAEENTKAGDKTHEMWPSDEDIEQSFRNANVLPGRQGGGVIFPGDFLGSGFHVDQETFDRYCADRSGKAVETSRWRSKARTLFYLALFAIFVLGVLFGRKSMALPPFYWVDVTTLFAVATLALATLIRLGRSAQTFLMRYPAVASVRPGAFLWRRLLGLMAAGVHNYWRSLFRACLLLLVVFLPDGAWAVGSAPWSLTFVTLAVLVAGLVALGFVIVHIGFRLRHGRPPTPKDLGPV